MDHNIRINHLSRRYNHLVDTSLPQKSPSVSHQPLPVIRKERISFQILRNGIFHHNHVRVRIHGLLQTANPFTVLICYHIVRVQPHAIVHGRPGKRLISCRRKIISPGKIIHLFCKFSCNLPGFVLWPRIHNNNLIHKFTDRFQTPLQYLLLIFYNHTQTDSNQKIRPRHIFLICYERICLYGTKRKTPPGSR